MEEYIKVDLDSAEKRLGMNKDFLINLINKLLNGDMLDKAEVAFNENNLEEAKLHIHSIKGATASVGLDGLHELALHIETRIKEESYLDFEKLKIMREIWEELKIKDFNNL